MNVKPSYSFCKKVKNNISFSTPQTYMAKPELSGCKYANLKGCLRQQLILPLLYYDKTKTHIYSSAMW